mmetsp:Transcript_56872/g.94099  ORF Transcript_56872/g.94099 Transcript_56872/m.94099 type:complete len:119 (+) Transcript_56872:15-371(+)
MAGPEPPLSLHSPSHLLGKAPTTESFNAAAELPAKQGLGKQPPHNFHEELMDAIRSGNNRLRLKPVSTSKQPRAERACEGNVAQPAHSHAVYNSTSKTDLHSELARVLLQRNQLLHDD